MKCQKTLSISSALILLGLMSSMAAFGPTAIATGTTHRGKVCLFVPQEQYGTYSTPNHPCTNGACPNYVANPKLGSCKNSIGETCVTYPVTMNQNTYAAAIIPGVTPCTCTVGALIASIAHNYTEC